MWLLARFVGLDKVAQVAILIVGIVAIVLCLSFGVGYAWRGWKIALLERELQKSERATVEARAARARCEHESNGLKEALERQNAAIAALERRSVEAEKRAKEAIAAGKRESATLDRRASLILAEPKPQKDTSCEAANTLLSRFMRGER